MIRLSDRMSKIAAYIGKDEKVGDIGTDHAHIPIFLWQNHITRNIIVSDINPGPIEKAKENIIKELGEIPFEVRQSDGLCGFECGEIDTAIIAGMGGILIRDILSGDIKKTLSIKKFILQPRNAQKELRSWLLSNGFAIEDEALATEGRYICEIIAARQDEYAATRHGKGDLSRLKSDSAGDDEITFDVPELLFENNDPLLLAFIDRKIKTQEAIKEAISRSVPERDSIKYEQASVKIEKLKAMRNRISK